MNDETRNTPENAPAFAEQVGAKAARKLRAKRNATPGVWFGLGMMGLIGWSVVVPTLLGAALGLWLDQHYPGGRSWTLALLVAGLALGCFNAWLWVAKEDQAMRDEQFDTAGKLSGDDRKTIIEIASQALEAFQPKSEQSQKTKQVTKPKAKTDESKLQPMINAAQKEKP